MQCSINDARLKRLFTPKIFKLLKESLEDVEKKPFISINYTLVVFPSSVIIIILFILPPLLSNEEPHYLLSVELKVTQ